MLRIRICSHMNHSYLLQQSLTAFGGAPFAQGSLSCYHAFGLIDKPKFIPSSTDTHRTLGAPSVHRCPPRPWLSRPESWREAPERDNCTDFTYKLPTEQPHQFLTLTAFLHELSAHPSPPPFGRYLSRRERQGAVCKLKTER